MARWSQVSRLVSVPLHPTTCIPQLTPTSDSGVAQGWGTAAECQAAACGTYATHEYINTKIIMDVADPNYANTKGTTGASGNLVTNDGGKTWTVDSIKIQGGVFA